MLDHDPHFRRQLARERHDELARDYRLAQPHERERERTVAARRVAAAAAAAAVPAPPPRAGVPTLMRTDPELIAARLGIDAAHVQRLQARGYLTRLELSEAEIRERLYIAHVQASLAGCRQDPRRRVMT